MNGCGTAGHIPQTLSSCVRIDGNEAIRTLLLEHAGLGVVPFQAFGLEEETGWFRLSVGAVSLDEIAQMFPRVKGFLDRIR
jgi:aspartate aminotransferase